MTFITGKKSGGMTLIELLVVIGIIGMILATGVPALTGYAKQVRLKTTTRQVVGLVSLARSTAISTRTEHTVIVDADAREVRVVNRTSGEALEQIVRLPSSISVEMEVGGQTIEQMEFSFRPSGALTGRSVSLVLADSQKQQTVVVTGTTGAVSVQ